MDRPLNAHERDLLAHIIRCERDGHFARPTNNASRNRLEAAGLIQERPGDATTGKNRKPYWVATLAGRRA